MKLLNCQPRSLAGPLPAPSVCVDLSAGAGFCSNHGRIREERIIRSSKRPLLDITAQVENAAVFVRQFHELATRNGEPSSDPPVKQPSVATFWVNCSKVLARRGMTMVESDLCATDRR